MRNYNLATIYYLGKVRNGRWVPSNLRDKATVYYDTVTEYYDLPKKKQMILLRTMV